MDEEEDKEDHHCSFVDAVLEYEAAESYSQCKLDKDLFSELIIKSTL